MKSKTITCRELEDFGNKKRKRVCRKEKAKEACPGICDRRCFCKDKTAFKIKPNRDNDFRGKFWCKNVNKDQQPSCTNMASMEMMVGDLCPVTCNFCF